MRVAGGRACPEADQLAYDLRQGLRAAFDDDLNLPAAVAAVFKTAKRINTLAAGGLLDVHGAGRLVAALRDIDAVLNLFDFGASPAVDAKARELLAARERARASGDWSLADRLRAELIARGVSVQDAKVNQG
jgi:cysteinyl-tRNA synthetase